MCLMYIRYVVFVVSATEPVILCVFLLHKLNKMYSEKVKLRPIIPKAIYFWPYQNSAFFVKTSDFAYLVAKFKSNEEMRIP